MQNLSPVPMLEALKAAALESLSDIATGQFPLEISPLSLPNGVEPDQKLLVKNSLGQPFAVILCSPPDDPDAVARNTENAHLAQQVLDANWHKIFLHPLATGRIQGLSYGIFPYCQLWSDISVLYRIQRHLVSPKLLAFVRRVAELTCTKVKPDEIEASFITPLRYLAELESMPHLLRSRAAYALDQIRSGHWFPRYVLMHSDLWGGNVLFRADKPNRFGLNHSKDSLILIDWTDSLIKGYAFYDLICLATSLSLRRSKVRRHLAVHCEILGCDLEDAHCYFIAAIAHFAMNVKWCPLENLVPHAISGLTLLDEIVPIDLAGHSAIGESGMLLGSLSFDSSR